MRRQLLLGQAAARSVFDTNAQPYICRQCLAKTRTLHSSAQRLDDRTPSWKKLLNRIVGSNTESEAIKKREEAQAKKLDDLATGAEVQQKSVTFKGVEYRVAELITPRIRDDYVPATSLEELPSIGSEKWVKQLADQGEKYSSPVRSSKSGLTNDQWEELISHELIHILTLVKNGLPADAILGVTGKFEHCTRAAILQVRGSDVELSFPTPEIEAELVRPTETPVDAEQSTSEESPSVPEQQAQSSESTKQQTTPSKPRSSHPAWKHVPLKDLAIKLALVKRIYQRTGRQVPDMEMSRATNAVDIYRAMIVKPPPKRLSDTQQVHKLKSAELPNVTVHSSRRTPIHKEKDVGRWKIIVEELQRRGLPVTGSKWTKAKITSMHVPKKPKKHTNQRTKGKKKKIHS